MVYPVHMSYQKIKDCMDLLLITDKKTSSYVYIKDFNRFMFNKIKGKSKVSNVVNNALLVKEP